MGNSASAQRIPDSNALANASAALAAALHGDNVRDEVYAVVEASVEAELEGVRRLNDVRSQFGRSRLDLRIGGWWHDCHGSPKPVPEPRKPGDPPLHNTYWRCEKLAGGCYDCRYVEITEVVENKPT